MSGWTTESMGAGGDAFYEALTEAHEGLSDADSRRLNARLVLLLASRIGDLETLREALAAARKGLGEPPS